MAIAVILPNDGVAAPIDASAEHGLPGLAGDVEAGGSQYDPGAAIRVFNLPALRAIKAVACEQAVASEINAGGVGGESAIEITAGSYRCGPTFGTVGAVRA